VFYYVADYWISHNLEICEKVGMAHDVNKKISQGCQGGTRRILAVGTLYYHFQQKIAYIPNLTVPLCFYSTIYYVAADVESN